MQLFRHAGTGAPLGAVIAIGNFDGVHLGHRAVVADAKALAKSLGAPLALLTFEPHPRSVFAPNRPPFRLTPFRAKTRLIWETGVDFLFTLRFDRAFAAKTAEQFVADLLIGRLGVKHVVIGQDFTFGKGRGGNPALLRAMGATLGFGVTVLEPVADANGKICSASRIRDHLAAGRPRAAAELLGRDWEIEGRVQQGDRRGRELGFPTANLAIANYLHPAPGVYAVRAGVIERGGLYWYSGVANFGNRPTFAGTDWRLETHIFNYAGDLYGRHVRVALVDFIRPDAKFDSAETLIAAMNDDAKKALAILVPE
ncbi:MAG TPA: bifunctional riboflavin kinase/FAD synthetase [Stellaceae bacterium]|jgi:riboflavin kinase/FMN adenylyltransferase|nr:bifunctional riboflavin kinase/FAD synthetase [Stellaceae bacterium]